MFRVILIATLACAGCASAPESPPRVEYIPVPAALLEECELPAKPSNNGELSYGYAQAYRCAEQGNRDKRRIRDLTAPN